MNNEILNLFKDETVNGFIITDELYQNFKNYITNLQEENKHLNDLLDNALNEKEQLEYRIDKANEIIDEVLFVGVKDYRSQLEIIQKVINGGDSDE